MTQNIELFTRFVIAYWALIENELFRESLDRTSPLGILDELIHRYDEHSEVSLKDIIAYLNVVAEIAPNSRAWCAGVRVSMFLITHAGVRVTVPKVGEVYFTRTISEKNDGHVRWQLVIVEDEIKNAAVDMAYGSHGPASEYTLEILQSLAAA
jgi:hypothetical protein